MAEFTLANAGFFRANPEASRHNNLRLVDEETPGTLATDAGTVDTTSGKYFDGIEYKGKGMSAGIYIPFTKQQFPDGNKTPFQVSVDEGREALRNAIVDIVGEHEVNPIVTVTGTSVSFIVTHKGAGTLSGVYMDGAKTALTRT